MNESHKVCQLEKNQKAEYSSKPKLIEPILMHFINPIQQPQGCINTISLVLTKIYPIQKKTSMDKKISSEF